MGKIASHCLSSLYRSSPSRRHLSSVYKLSDGIQWSQWQVWNLNFDECMLPSGPSWNRVWLALVICLKIKILLLQFVPFFIGKMTYRWESLFYPQKNLSYQAFMTKDRDISMKNFLVNISCFVGCTTSVMSHNCKSRLKSGKVICNGKWSNNNNVHYLHALGTWTNWRDLVWRSVISWRQCWRLCSTQSPVVGHH